MLVRIFLALVCGFVPVAFAQAKKHKAHVHGAAKINLVVEAKKAQFEFIAPGHDVFGFESEPKNDAQRKIVADALEKLRSGGETLVKFDEKIACIVTNNKAEVIREGGHHNEVVAQYSVTCPALIAGTDIKFGVTQLLPSVKSVVVQLIADTKQVGATIKGDVGSMRVPPEVK